MPIPQSSIAPLISRSESLDIITLKNLVALDLVESNENLLRVFGLLDEQNKKRKNITTGSSIKGRVEKLRKLYDGEKNALQRLTNDFYKKEESKTTKLLQRLTADFGKDFDKTTNDDEAIIDDTDEVAMEFERENEGISVKFDESQMGIYVIKEQEKIPEPEKTPIEEEEDMGSQGSNTAEIPSSQATILVPSSQMLSAEQGSQPEQPQTQTHQDSNSKDTVTASETVKQLSEPITVNVPTVSDSTSVEQPQLNQEQEVKTTEPTITTKAVTESEPASANDV
ncbi:hypothetical protein WICPIJ_009237 [Wickerhamomyces pijperi]|uniref:Uncharacterized protein n=1 Tax=Wickerhamomyces pijperi TaxID=599730 RepID=A0A9P8TEF7_WICPI|nr:hypothetical protein WICPIJ_009237 [Wickerhamomyces pijperi]